MYEGKLKMELELSSHPSSSLHVVEEAGDIFLFSCFFPFFHDIYFAPHHRSLPIRSLLPAATVHS